MSKELGLELIEADTLKAGLNIPVTCQAWKQFGGLDKENAIKGLLFVRDRLRNIVRDAIYTRENILIEGAFLDPHDLMQWGQGILVVTRNYEKHHGQFFIHRQASEETKSEFAAARIVQEFLIEEATRIDIKIHENL